MRKKYKISNRPKRTQEYFKGRYPGVWKRGWIWEWLRGFKVRKYCNFSCVTTARHKREGHTIWSKELVIKKFKAIKNKNKWNYTWMSKNKHNLIRWGITKYYGKNAWSKFVKEMGQKPLFDYDVPLRKRFIKYLMEEQDMKIGDVFEYSSGWGLPFEEKIHNRSLGLMLKLLVQKRALRIIKKGKRGYRYLGPTQYQLLKTRI